MTDLKCTVAPSVPIAPTFDSFGVTHYATGSIPTHQRRASRNIREFLAADGIEWTAFELDEGEPVPDLPTFDALWVMGGPMDVWEVDEHPWLTDDSAIKRAVVERRMPFFGFCLGHQLWPWRSVLRWGPQPAQRSG